MNLVVLKGRLTKDPETRVIQNTDRTITNFAIAVDRRFAKENEQKVDFFNCSAFGKTGEFISKYFKKGQEILINGELRISNSKGQDGTTRTYISVTVNEAEFCGSRNSNTNQNTTIEETMANNNIEVNTISNDDDLPF